MAQFTRGETARAGCYASLADRRGIGRARSGNSHSVSLPRMVTLRVAFGCINCQRFASVRTCRPTIWSGAEPKEIGRLRLRKRARRWRRYPKGRLNKIGRAGRQKPDFHGIGTSMIVRPAPISMWGCISAHVLPSRQTSSLPVGARGCRHNPLEQIAIIVSGNTIYRTQKSVVAMVAVVMMSNYRVPVTSERFHSGVS
jgi:hypothetical protein